MIELTTNTAGQTIYLTLNEGKQYFATDFTHYLFILIREENTVTGGLDLAQVAQTIIDNERYTELTITTVGLETRGAYHYKVYGQNSASNVDPLNASVVGLVERGSATLTDSTVYFTPNTTAIPDDGGA